MKKNVIPKWLSVLNILLLIIGAVLDVYLTATLLKGDTTTMVTAIGLACACCFGLLYAIYGYQKDVATYAQWFYGVFAIALASKFYFLNAHTSILLPTIVEFACLAILTIVKDLGKKRSMNICITTLVASLICPIYFVLTGNNIYALMCVTEVILSFVLLIMMYAKYKDKEARGSK